MGHNRCRLCDLERIPDKYPQDKLKHRDTILLVTGLDVSKDLQDDTIPRYICPPCITKLTRGKKTKYKKKGGKVHWDIPCYPQESDSVDIKFNPFLDFVQKLKIEAESLGFIDASSEDTCVFAKLQPVTCDITHKLVVHNDFSWVAYAGKDQVSTSVPCLQHIPDEINLWCAVQLLRFLVDCNKCTGNTGFHLILANALDMEQNELLCNDQKTVLGRISENSVYSTKCLVYVNEMGTYCTECGAIRGKLRGREGYFRNKRFRSVTPKTAANSRASLRTLTPSQKNERFGNLQANVQSLSRKVKILQARIESIPKQDSEEVSANQSSSSQTIVHTSPPC